MLRPILPRPILAHTKAIYLHQD
uniref:Uncharacterized protein n=1 Tax=Arundo donax TaxID=35708 RepID=A0A0A9BYF2_ARUDO